VARNTALSKFDFSHFMKNYIGFEPSALRVLLFWYIVISEVCNVYRITPYRDYCRPQPVFIDDHLE
jgi:hypothetical protein